MRLYIQYARTTPQDWVQYDIVNASDYGNIPDKGVPDGGSVLDDTDGWVYAINVQGCQWFGWDHFSGDISGDGLVVIVWNDSGTAEEWTFLSPKHVPFEARTNTDQALTVYTDDQSVIDKYTGQTTASPTGVGRPVVILPWASFSAPSPAARRRHGFPLDAGQEAAHQAVQTLHGWQEWDETVSTDGPA